VGDCELQEYRIIRLRDGKKMAEGARVLAISVADALVKAKQLFSEPECAGDTYEVEEDFA